MKEVDTRWCRQKKGKRSSKRFRYNFLLEGLWKHFNERNFLKVFKIFFETKLNSSLWWIRCKMCSKWKQFHQQACLAALNFRVSVIRNRFQSFYSLLLPSLEVKFWIKINRGWNLLWSVFYNLGVQK